MSKSLSRRKAGKARKRSGDAGVRWLLIALVLLAVLVILLRMAEFTNHRGRPVPHRIVPATLLP